MCSNSNLIGGPDYYVDNNIFIDLSPYLEEYSPNYNYVRYLDEATLPTTITDKGYVPGFWQIAKTLQWPWVGPLGRTDWLKELNISIPETYDELHDALVAFRDQKKAEFPLALSDIGLDGWLMAGFNTMYQPAFGGALFIQIDGKVHFGATEPGFKEYVTLMNQWYTEGLIDKEFYTKTGFDTPPMKTADILGNKVGVGRSLYTFPDFITNLSKASGTEIEWNGFYLPVKNKGDSIKVSEESAATNLYKGGIGTVSTQCGDVENLMRWYDYFYTEDGSLLANYGIEGQGFNYDANGKPKTTELIYTDKDGRAMNSMFPIYAMAQSQPMWYDWERELSPTTSQNVLDTQVNFLKNWTGARSVPRPAARTLHELTRESGVPDE
jgi:putative aldouronate transport system substrate-binding protein